MKELKIRQNITNLSYNFQNYTVEIFYLPLVIVPYSEDLFFMPVFASLYPLLSPDVPRISKHHQAVTRGDKIKPLTNLGVC